MRKYYFCFMKIAADKNILYANDAFSTIGDVELFDLNEITNKNIRNFDALIIRSTTNVNKKLLENTKIKFVGSAVAGTDHIDIEYLQEQKIEFSSASGCNARSVAEYVLTAIYAFCKKNNAANYPISPKGLCVGIIGVGNIGGLVAEILQNLGIKILLNDPILEKQGQTGFSPLEKLAENCDIITVHTPLTKSGEFKTEGLLGEDFFAKMKPNALLIQASRGAVCDENSLLQYLSNNYNSRSAVDVWENEPSINFDLAKRCFFRTPHIAGHSFDGKINGTKIIYEKCCKFFSKKPTFDFEKEVFSKIEKQTLVFNENITEILLKCCPIDKDTEEFNKLLEISDENERKNAFKKQRANYRKRLEFSHYKVKNAPAEIAKDLKILGFSV